MSLRKSIAELENTLEIMKKFENHTPPLPEAGCFYRTYNDSIVFVYEVDSPRGGDAGAVILKGGYGREEAGDSYWLSEEGYHNDDDPGPHLVMGLKEKLDIQLPE